MPRHAKDPLLARVAWTLWAGGQIPVQRRVPFRPSARLAERCDRRVRAAVAFAYANVPHYRESIDRLGMAPGSFRTVRDLARLPLIERDQLQLDPERFVSRALARERYTQLATEGSTGAPVIVQHDPFALFQGAAHYERGEVVAWRLARRRLVLRRALIEITDGTTARTRGAVRSRSVVSPGIRYRDLHLSMTEPVSRNAQKVLAFAPDELRGYGSYVEALFVHLHRSRMHSGLPRVVVYGEDGISLPTLKLISEDFGIPVLSEYGAGEAHHIAFECEAHAGLHVNEDIYPVRLVDAEGADVQAEQPGEVVVSNLVNRGTVLLNYRLGDVASWVPGRCSCGRTLSRISLPQGRTDEWVVGEQGELVHGQEVRGLLLADDAFLLGFQVAQEAPQEFLVRAVVRDGCDHAAFRAGVERRFADRFGSGTRTRIDFVPALEPTSRAKVKTIISHAGVRRPPPAGA